MSDIHPEAKKRVERGAELLDRLYGDKWRDEVDPAVLKMSSCKRCVLGQFAGHFNDGIEYVAAKIGKDVGTVARDYGFDAVDEPDDLDVDSVWSDEFYANLTKAWVEVLTDE